MKFGASKNDPKASKSGDDHRIPVQNSDSPAVGLVLFGVVRFQKNTTSLNSDPLLKTGIFQPFLSKLIELLVPPSPSLVSL